jgi:hypothetical protein
MSIRKPEKKVKGFRISRENFLKAKPMRYPELEWEEDEKGLHVRIPRKRTLWFRILSKFLPLKRESRVVLDEQGAFIWKLCDGEHRTREIAEKLGEKYKIQVPDAENALKLYLSQLSKSGLVGFALADSTRKRYHRKFG